MAALAQEGAVLRARIIPLLLALGLRRSHHVRVMRGTTATLMRHQAYAMHRRPVGTRVNPFTTVRRSPCAMRVQRTRLLLALGLRRSHHVRVMRGTTATLAQEGAVPSVTQRAMVVEEPLRVSAKLGILLMITVGVVLLVLQASTRQLMATELALTVQRTRLLLALGLRRSQIVRVMWETPATLHQAQAHAPRARQASTRMLLATEIALCVTQTALVVKAPLWVSAMKGITILFLMAP